LIASNGQPLAGRGDAGAALGATAGEADGAAGDAVGADGIGDAVGSGGNVGEQPKITRQTANLVIVEQRIDSLRAVRS
jgi:hypothetical protein